MGLRGGVSARSSGRLLSGPLARVGFQRTEAMFSNIILGSQIAVLVLCIYILSPEHLRPPSSLSYRDVNRLLMNFFKPPLILYN